MSVKFDVKKTDKGNVSRKVYSLLITRLSDSKVIFCGNVLSAIPSLKVIIKFFSNRKLILKK
jgi:hypothetical protein